MNRLEFMEKSEDLKTYEVDKEGWLRKEGRSCVPDAEGLKKEVLGEGTILS